MDEQQRYLKKLNRRTRFTQFLVWIALFFTAAGIAAGYKNWLRIHHKAKAGLAGIAEIKEEIPSFAKKQQIALLQTNFDKQLNNNAKQFDKTLKELRQIKSSTEHLAKTVYQQIEDITKYQEAAIAKTTQNQKSNAQDWSLSEIHFLLQTAVEVLSLRHDKYAAKTALELADKQLLKKGSSQYLPLRKQISLDIALLSEYALPNTSKLLEKINTLQTKIEVTLTHNKDKNTVAHEQTNTSATKKEKEAKEKNNDNLNSWFKKTLDKAIVIKKYDQSLQDSISNESKVALLQLLSLKLETLRITLLQADNKHYHLQISNIKSLIKKYYPEKMVSDINKELAYLDTVNLSPKIPNISKSLKLFQSIKAEK